MSKIQPIRARVSNVVCRNQIFQIEAGKFCAQSLRDLIRWNPAKDKSKVFKVSTEDIEIKQTADYGYPTQEFIAQTIIPFSSLNHSLSKLERRYFYFFPLDSLGLS